VVGRTDHTTTTAAFSDGGCGLKSQPPAPPFKLEKIAAPELPDWDGDQHSRALSAFLTSLKTLKSHVASRGRACAEAWSEAIERIETGGPLARDDGAAAADLIASTFDFIEIVPDRASDPDEIVFTGFFEPVVAASATRSANFSAPLYLRPPDLLALAEDHLRGAAGARLTYARATCQGHVPYWTRKEIADGALAGRELEFAYVGDDIDAFVLQVQGSGLLSFDDGSQMRITYDGKNGHPYASIGQWLIREGHVAASEMTLDRMVDWLRSVDPKVRKQALELNPSFVFFRPAASGEAAAQGAAGVDLTAGRSIAVDAGIYPLGALFHVTPDRDAGLSPGLMAAHDVGSAIRGARRVDVFCGTGADAGRRAGRVRHGGRLFVGIPRGVEVEVALPDLFAQVAGP
jgi:membrane-bound lytic murein transglycosylase A